MKWKQLTVGPVQANCYLLWNDNQEALIIDPGSEGAQINEEIEKLAVRPLAVLLTHAHFDHIGALEEVRNEWNVPVYLHNEEKEWLEDPDLNGSTYFPMGEPIRANKADEELVSEQALTIGQFSCKILHTPGHSPGSVSFYFQASNTVISGDVLFMGSIGRTDLPGGNRDQLLQSIHKQLLTLDEATIVLSGHGPSTTIGDEMATNPFLNGFS